MATAALQLQDETSADKRKRVLEELKAKVPTSKALAADVLAAIDELTAVDKAENEFEGENLELLPFLDFIEGVINQTPDAKLRERLLGLREIVAAHPKARLEQLTWLSGR